MAVLNYFNIIFILIFIIFTILIFISVLIFAFPFISTNMITFFFLFFFLFFCLLFVLSSSCSEVFSFLILAIVSSPYLCLHLQYHSYRRLSAHLDPFCTSWRWRLIICMITCTTHFHFRFFSTTQSYFFIIVL